MRSLLSVALFAACLAAAPVARAGTAGPPEAGSDVNRVRIPLLATLITDLAYVAHPFELAAVTMSKLLVDVPGMPVAHEDPDPCAQW